MSDCKPPDSLRCRLKSTLKPMSLLIGFAVVIPNDSAIAQLIPDNTLGTETSLVESTTVDAQPTEVITGGAQRDANLFHSFFEFNIADGQRVYFANPMGVDRILTRVTGGNPSSLLGTLGVLGTADLFLMNPQGFVFGPQARLDLRGSLLTTTADSFVFDNGDHFSAKAATAPLLTVNLPVGLQYGSALGAIINRSRVPSGVTTGGPVLGLRVPDGESLIMAGGDLWLEGGSLTALDGRLELGGLAASGTIGLTEIEGQLRLSFPDTIARADLSFTQGAIATVKAGGRGSIGIYANQVNVREGSLISTGLNRGAVLRDRPAGGITIQATDTVVLDGANSLIQSLVSPGSFGDGGDIDITARSLLVTNGGLLLSGNNQRGDSGDLNIQVTDAVIVSGVSSRNSSSISAQLFSENFDQGGNVTLKARSLSLLQGGQLGTATFGFGNAGNVILDITDAITIDGYGLNGQPSAVTSSVAPRAVGQGGLMDISTTRLSITKGGRLFSSTFGRGNAGPIRITAEDAVVLDGVGDRGFSSAVVSQVSSTGVGAGGDIEINATRLSLTNGAQLAAGTFGIGDAGSILVNVQDEVVFSGIGSNNIPSAALSDVGARAQGNGKEILIDAKSVTIKDGAQLFASTLGRGTAGSIRLIANRVDLQSGGQLNSFTAAAGKAGNITVSGAESFSLTGLNTGLFATTEADSTGSGGSIAIAAKTTTLDDQAKIAVDSQGTGEGGEIQIVSNSLTLDRQATISAETASNVGGDVTLTLPGLLLLRRGSSLSTNAGIAQGDGNGGNVRVNAGFVVAVPSEDSDITANAFRGQGGSVNIVTQGLFGIAFRDRLTPLSDITASSELGINGIVSIETPGIDPSQGTTQLPATFSPPPLAQTCQAGNGELGSFVNTGQGGLPPSPIAPLAPDTLWQDFDLLTSSGTSDQRSQKLEHNPIQTTQPQETDAIREAQGWIMLADGAIALCEN